MTGAALAALADDGALDTGSVAFVSSQSFPSSFRQPITRTSCTFACAVAFGDESCDDKLVPSASTTAMPINSKGRIITFGAGGSIRDATAHVNARVRAAERSDNGACAKLTVASR